LASHKRGIIVLSSDVYGEALATISHNKAIFKLLGFRDFELFRLPVLPLIYSNKYE
jgi:hypothetical protein